MAAQVTSIDNIGFVLVTLGLTRYQEGKAERAIEALRDLTSPRALVIRDETGYPPSMFRSSTMNIRRTS